MEVLKTNSEIENYENTKSAFTDFIRFEDDATKREKAKKEFLVNAKYVPEYDYPKMDEIDINEGVIEKKQNIYEAVLELEQAKKYSESDPNELELYASYLENKLKKIMLVEAANELYDPLSMSSYEANRKTFIDINESLYGKMNEDLYLGIVNTEKEKINNFVPVNKKAQDIKDSLGTFFSGFETKGTKEVRILDDGEIGKLHDYVSNRYSKILEAVPDTPDDKYYDVTECAQIMTAALKAGGLDDWDAVENPERSVVSTNSEKKHIFLPSNTSRNSMELKRLIIHEQEVHARRFENGKASGINILKRGTANNSDIEEGLGVILECAVSGNLDNASFDRARNRYLTAGLALGVDGTPRDARETFEALWRVIAVNDSIDGSIKSDDIDKAKNKAYTLTENAFRGTQFWMKGVIYSKLKIYYEGLVENAHFLKSNIDNLDEAFDEIMIGKYDYTDPIESTCVKSIIANKKNQ